MSALNNSALIGASGSAGYQISRSVRLRSSASAYFNRTFGTPTDNRKFTLSFWCKRGSLSTAQTMFSCALVGNEDQIIFNSTNTLRFYIDGALSGDIQTTAVFRDVSAYYHFIVVCDTANATATDRAIIYVNNVRQAVTGTNFTLNSVPDLNGPGVHSLGRYQPSGVNYFDGYLTEINFIDGQALTPTSFGETNTTTGVWSPIKYAGTYGTNGFYLNFSDNSGVTATTIGKDYSGNGNNWTPNNISVTAGATYDSMLDVPTQWADGGNGRGNYAVLNPLRQNSSGTFAQGNLAGTSESVTQKGLCSTIVLDRTDKWYMEWSPASNTTNWFGVTANEILAADINTAGQQSVLYYASTGNKYVNGTVSAYGTSYTTQTIGIAFDGPAGTVTFYRDNVSQGAITLPSSTVNYVFCMGNAAVGGVTNHANFGQRPFTYTPPSGFKALNTLNLPTPTILKGNQYFDATTYTGNGGTQSIVNSGAMQPDLVWNKARSSATSHNLTDSVRGVQKSLFSNLTSVELASCELTAFNSNGYTLVRDVSRAEQNENAVTYVGWQWKEGATQGFDIVTYTGDGVDGRTVAHNLGVAPKMVIVKSRSTVTDWNVKHASLSSNNVLQLNATNAQNTPGSGYIGDLNSSTTFTLKNGGAAITNVNGNGTTYVAYLFSEVAGFSKFGSYTGNGSADGPFVFCGFRPRFVMWKNASAAEAWLIEDTARSTYNEVALELYPSSSGAEAAGSSRSPTQQFDFLSNGFKVRGAQSQTNGNGNTIIFAAFSESPFKNALAR